MYKQTNSCVLSRVCTFSPKHSALIGSLVFEDVWDGNQYLILPYLQLQEINNASACGVLLKYEKFIDILLPSNKQV